MTHQPNKARRRGPRWRVANQMSPRGSTAKMVTALAPPMRATATPERAAARRGDPSREPVTKGMSIQGSKMPASSCTEIVVHVKTMGAAQ
jgi:hypothetical protein